VALDVRILQGEDAFRGIGHYTRGLTEALLRLAAGGQAGVEYALLVAAEHPRPELRTDGAVAIVEMSDGAAAVVEMSDGAAAVVEMSECALKGRGDRAQGEALGKADNLFSSPERAQGETFRLNSVWPELLRALSGVAERLPGRERGAGALLRAARARGLHVASPLHGPFPWACWRGGRTVATFYDLIPLLQAGKFLDRWPPEARRRYLRRVARLAQLDALFAISQSAAEDAIAHAGVPRERVHVAYPGLRDVFLKAAAPAPESGDAAPYVLAFGSSNPSKNTPLLFEAWRRLSTAARAGHALRLVVAAGQGHGEVSVWGGDDSTTVVAGPSDAELARLYAQATCFVCPSRAEGFGLPPLEAAAAGAPVIASDLAVLREVLGDSAEYFSPDSAKDLAGVLGRVLGDAGLRAGLSARGRARVREFAWEGTARAVAREHVRLGR
jgi:glycosyltransferase involved in cell wall biosynthesis